MNIKIDKFIQYIILIFQRSLIFFIIIVLLSHLVINYKRLKFKVQINAINYAMPSSFNNIVEVVREKKKINYEMFSKYIEFYSRIIQFFPERADAHGMLGFCYYHGGYQTKSIHSYEKAIEAKTFGMNEWAVAKYSDYTVKCRIVE